MGSRSSSWPKLGRKDSFKDRAQVDFLDISTLGWAAVCCRCREIVPKIKLDISGTLVADLTNALNLNKSPPSTD